MVVLGIETSCDEASAAVIDETGSIRSNVVWSQLDHAPYGGVVPELASRAHTRTLLPVIARALQDADITLDQLHGVAVTCGPGLVGSLLVGVNAAKGLAFGRGLHLIGVHHLEGHLLSAGIGRELTAPYVALLVSGGHTELLLVRQPGSYRCLGRTLDDAAGEAFDKVARLLSLLPADRAIIGGRAVAESAERGDPKAVDFPRPLPERDGLDFSFSGLKTAVLNHLRRLEQTLGPRGVGDRVPDVAASFQEAVVDVLVDRTTAAVRRTGVDQVALVGGVAANRRLRQRMAAVLSGWGVRLLVPDLDLCTDNAAMIAAAGRFRLCRGERSAWDLDASPRLPLPGVEE